MIVFADALDGTIGGGALEYEAIAHARNLLKSASIKPWYREVQTRPLGPSLGQCCGGSVRLLFERYDDISASPFSSEEGYIVRPLISGIAPYTARNRKALPSDLPLSVTRALTAKLSGQAPSQSMLIEAGNTERAWWIEPNSQNHQTLVLYGAGHVGRAVVKAFVDLPFDIIWVDTSADRFPDIIPANAIRLVAIKPAEAVAHTPLDAIHIVMTYSHPIDLDICHAVLKRGAFSFLGLIGSKTKRARFIKRLRDLGVDQASLSRLTCPIGIEGLKGKEPATIALSVAAQMVQLSQARNDNIIKISQHDRAGA